MKTRIEEFRISLDGGHGLFAKEVVALKEETSDPYAVIVVHGGPGLNSHEESFAGLKNLLTGQEESFSTIHALIFYDQLGCGSSDKPMVPASSNNESALYTLHYYIQELHQVIQAVKHRHPTCRIGILGHSWGGQVLLEFLLQTANTGNEPSCHCAIISNSPLNERTYAKRQLDLFLALDEDVRSFLEQDEDEAALEQSMDAVIYRKLIGKTDRSITGEMADWDALQRLHQLSRPCLFATGTNDTIPYQEYESLPQLQYPHLTMPPEVFIQENAEHGPFYGESAKDYFHQIVRFLEKNR